MPMAQLPITAYLSPPGQSSKRGSQSGSPKVSPKRRRSQAHDREAAPSRKKRKQKENLTPQASLQDVESKLDEPIDGARHGPRRRRNSDPKASTKDPEDSEEEDPVNILDDIGLDRAASKAIIDLTSTDSLDDGFRVEATVTRRLETPPISPQQQHHRRGTFASGSLPFPSLTAPDTRRLKDLRREEERRVQEMLERRDSVLDEETSPSKRDEEEICPSTDSQRENVGGSLTLAPRLRESSLVLMPPPDLPSRVGSTSVTPRPLPGPVQKPSSTSSDKWVPSSQTQELSVPVDHGPHRDSPSDHTSRTPFVGETQVVPSSQMEELELSPASPRGPEFPHLRVGISRSVDSDASGGPPSPEVIESSQQMELELDAAWAQTVAARIAAIGWSKTTDGETKLQSPSPSPRETESQDYDAQDELSSQEGNSEASSYEVFTSPLHMPSQVTESSASYDSQPTVGTPPQLRRFRSMFEGRDERGNELPSGGQDSNKPRSPSVSHDGGHHTSFSPHMPEQHSSDETYSSSSSLSQTQPTPVRNFLAMFDSQTDAEPSQVSDI